MLKLLFCFRKIMSLYAEKRGSKEKAVKQYINVNLQSNQPADDAIYDIFDDSASSKHSSCDSSHSISISESGR